MTPCHLQWPLARYDTVSFFVDWWEHMPKPTFFNLKKEKRRALIEAAKKEFSRASLCEASISNILKEAGIPRGSFYQYFADKEDAFYYLLNEYMTENHARFVAYLKRYDGDLFDTMTALFQSVLEVSQDQEHHRFIRNVILLNMNYKVRNILVQPLNEESFHRYREISQLVNTRNLDIEGERELFHVLQIIIAVTMHNLICFFEKRLSVEEALNKYASELELLKRGLMKKS